MTPLISIGISCFNASDTIEKAVMSALAQNWPNTEIIIVDDCSSDDSPQILEKLDAEHSKVRVYFQSSNGGVAAVRNEIINLAMGEFLVFFDDDDESDPDRIQSQYQRITTYEEEGTDNPVICHTARLQKYADGTERYESTMGMGSGLAPNGEAVALRTLTGKNLSDISGSTATCSQMARLSTYKKLNGFDASFRRSEDTDFNIRAALAGAHFVGLEQPLVIQRMTKTFDKTLDDEEFFMLKLIEKHKDFIEKHTSARFCRDWIITKHRFLKKQYFKFGSRILWLFVKSPIQTFQRIKWAMPNMSANLQFKNFHNDKK